MLRILAFLLAVICCCSFLFWPMESDAAGAPAVPVRAFPPPPNSAAAAVLYAPRYGVFLAEKGADTVRPMASTTKIMTALVVLEHANPEEVLTVPPAAVGVEGSSMYLYAGEIITVETLLKGLLLSSANDAAEALALHVAGSIPAFAALMNEKAAALGLSHTHFENPHGLPAKGHATTARELALLTAAALEHPLFAKLVATYRTEVKQEGTGVSRLFLNHNRLLRTYEGAVGVKTGYTRESGRCLVSAAEREGLLLIAVTLNDPADWQDHKALFDFGFSHYRCFSPALSPLEIPLIGGETPTLRLVPKGEISLLLEKDAPAPTLVAEYPHFLFAGVKEGEEKGRIYAKIEGKTVGELPLLAEKDAVAVPQKRHLFDFFTHLFCLRGIS